MVNGSLPDAKQCGDGRAHVWAYRGKKKQVYGCTRCAFEISKQDLQEATN